MISMFLVSQDIAWRQVVQRMYDSCIRLVYIVDPARPMEEMVGFELGELTYVTK